MDESQQGEDDSPGSAKRISDGAVQGVPPATRWVVRCFLAAFLACAVLGVEAWPFTGFRLFSTLREETRNVWVADTVALDGRETRLWFSELPAAYQGFHLIMPGFRHLSPSAQRASCEAWLAEARRVQPSAVELRIYRATWQALPRNGDRPATRPVRTLRYACS
jgi:hypothetical protein